MRENRAYDITVGMVHKNIIGKHFVDYQGPTIHGFYIWFILIIDNLKELLKSGKDVHLVYGHYTQEEWTDVLNCNKDNGGVNAIAEMKKLKEYIDAHSGIKGIILANFLSDVCI